MTIEQGRILGQLTLNLDEGMVQSIHPDTVTHEALKAVREVLAGNDSFPIIEPALHIVPKRIKFTLVNENGEAL